MSMHVHVLCMYMCMCCACVYIYMRAREGTNLVHFVGFRCLHTEEGVVHPVSQLQCHQARHSHIIILQI